MLKDWSPLCNRYLDRQPSLYSDFIAEFPESLSPLREYAADNPLSFLADTIKNLKPPAPGADGWNVCEMQSLSHIAIELLTEIFNTIELCAIWPSTLFEVPVAALRKGEGSSPLDIRPISLTPILYRIWARARFTQLQPWHVQWLPSQLRGGAPGRDAVDAFYDLALEAEFCAQTNRPLYLVETFCVSRFQRRKRKKHEKRENAEKREARENAKSATNSKNAKGANIKTIHVSHDKRKSPKPFAYSMI